MHSQLSSRLGLERRLRNGLVDVAERIVKIDRLLLRKSPHEEDAADDDEPNQHPRSPFQRVARIGVEGCVDNRRQDDDPHRWNDIITHWARLRAFTMEVPK